MKLNFCDYVAKSRERLLSRGYIIRTLTDLMSAARATKPQPYADRPSLAKYQIEPDQFTATYLLKLHDRANWWGTDPKLMYFYARLHAAMKKQGFPIYCHTAYRSPELQRTLMKQGYSKVSSGAHQRGAAIDVVHAYYNWDASKEWFDLLGTIGMEIAASEGIKIRWGGDWDGDGTPVWKDADEQFYDPAHFEMADWRSRPEMETTSISRFTPTAIRKVYPSLPQEPKDEESL